MCTLLKGRASAVLTWGLALLAVICLVAQPADAARRRSPGTVARGTIQVRSAIVVDAKTGRVLYEQNADASIPPASLTKIASMYVALDAVSAGKVRLGDTVKVSRKAARQGGSRMFLKSGDRVTLDRLLFGMAISSGNDASLAVAEKVAGNGATFVRMMNNKMRSLGLKGTTFKNVHGLPAKGQFTTARDMARLSVAYLKAHPKALRYHSARAMRHNGVVTSNKNPLLRTYAGADGLKTGWVNASGYNVITTAKRGNLRLVAVVMGAPDSNTRAREVRRLMDAGFLAAEKKTTVASVLGVGGKKQTVAADRPARKGTKANASVRASSSKKKDDQVRTASNSRKRDQVTSGKKKQSTPQRARSTSRQAADNGKTGSSRSKSGWSSSGSLMDS